MTQKITQLLPVFSVIIILAITGYIIPFVAKKGIVFGIRSPEGSGNRQLLYFFKISYWISTTSFLIIIGFLYSMYPQIIIGGSAIFIQIFLIYTILIIFNRKAARLKELAQTDKAEEIKAVDTQFRKEQSAVSLFWFIPSLIIALTQILLFYNMNGTSLIDALKQSIPPLFILLISVVIYLIIKTTKQDISINFPKTSKIQDHIFRFRWSVFIVVFSFLLTAFYLVQVLQNTGLIQISNNTLFIIQFILTISLLIYPVILALKTGQSGSLVRAKAQEQGNELLEYDDDKYWKMGLVYVNTKDPSIFVAKRMGIGWTVNFGNPAAVFIVMSAIIMALTIVYLTR